MALRPAAPSPHKQVGHITAPTSNAKQLFELANGGPSTHGSGRLSGLLVSVRTDNTALEPVEAILVT